MTLKSGQNFSEVANQDYSNSDFEGFCVDLIEELSRALKFRYKIKPITTSHYDDMVEEIKTKVNHFLRLFRVDISFKEIYFSFKSLF